MANPISTLINGHRFDWSSIEFSVDGIGIYATLTEINYSQSLEPGHLRGTRPQKLGRTRGQYEAECSFTIYKEDYEQLITKLQLKNPTRGYMENSFLITVMYQEVREGALPITDTLQGCRITSDEDAHSSGNEPLMVAVEVDPIRILRNGKFAVLDNNGVP